MKPGELLLVEKPAMSLLQLSNNGNDFEKSRCDNCLRWKIQIQQTKSLRADIVEGLWKALKMSEEHWRSLRSTEDVGRVFEKHWRALKIFWKSTEGLWTMNILKYHRRFIHHECSSTNCVVHFSEFLTPSFSTLIFVVLCVVHVLNRKDRMVCKWSPYLH